MSSHSVSQVPRGRHRNWCNCRGCLNRIAAEEADLTKVSLACWAIGAAVAGIIGIALTPLRIWHTTGADGKQHPDAATWIAYGVSAGIVLLALMFFSIRSASRTERLAAEKARIREALGAAGEDERGGPRRDLREMANEQEMTP